MMGKSLLQKMKELRNPSKYWDKRETARDKVIKSKIREAKGEKKNGRKNSY